VGSFGLGGVTGDATARTGAFHPRRTAEPVRESPQVALERLERVAERERGGVLRVGERVDGAAGGLNALEPVEEVGEDLTAGGMVRGGGVHAATVRGDAEPAIREAARVSCGQLRIPHASLTMA